MNTKVCKRCGEEKPLTEFYKAKGCKDGTRNDCRVCLSKLSSLSQSTRPDQRKQYMKEYFKNNKEKWKRTPEAQAKINERRRAKYAADVEYREKIKGTVKEYFKNNPAVKKSQRLKKYGLTLEEFNLLMTNHNHQCAICGYSDQANLNFFPVVDHCHTHKHVRGILCMNCNQALGKFKDNPELLRAAIIYLEERGGKDNDMVRPQH